MQPGLGGVVVGFVGLVGVQRGLAGQLHLRRRDIWPRVP